MPERAKAGKSKLFELPSRATHIGRATIDDRMGGTDLFKGAFGQVSSLADPVDRHFGAFDRGGAFSHGLRLFGRVAVTAEIDDGDGTHV